MSPTIFDVADFFLHRFQHDDGSSITHLKLQKLCYYAQSWHLAFNEGEPLVNAKFKAWVHGPVNVDLYNKYRDSSWQCIEPVESFNDSVFTEEQLELLEEILECLW